MKLKYFTAALGTILLAGLCARAQEADYSNDYVHRLGLGFELGEPIGLTAKYFLSDNLAADGAAGWSPFSHSVAEFHADLLVHDFDLLTPASGSAPVYIGGGIMGRFRDDGRSDLAGFRLPIGVSYMFENSSMSIYAEIAPVAIFAPFARAELDGDVGIRFWF
ncbi:MAG: hypothetical protein ACRED1_10295 [Limisphaerales bacterium]